MTDRIFNADLNFLENCNYNSSTTIKDITLSLQTPVVMVYTEKESYYYGDIVEVSSLVEYHDAAITNGVVDFYYININDSQGIKHKINDEPIPVDMYGNAYAKFIPYKDCRIIAEYNGDPYFGNASSEARNIHLNSIPTKIEFKDVPPYFVNPKDDVKLNVAVYDVRDRQNPVPIDYGIVTFLYYDVFDIDNPEDGQERVIGNPVYLIDGEASINYVPIQYENESNNTYNIQFIRAVYNYQNELYGVNWRKYYDMHSACNSIALLKPNMINISISKNNNGVFEPLTNDDVKDGFYAITNEDMIRFNFEIPEYTFSSDSKLKVCISGIDTPYYATYDGQKFKYDVTNLDSGLYYIYAVGMDDQGSYLKTEGGDPITITNINNTDYDIDNVLYLQSTESQHLYFQVEAKESEYTIQFTNAENHIISENLEPLTIKAKLTSEDPCFNSLLIGEECYFYCSTLEQTYSSIIQEENNKLYAELEIIDENLEYNVPLQLVNDYIFYAYIKTDTYTKECNGETISHKYTKHNSQPLTIKTRKNPLIDLYVTTMNNSYPGKIKYSLVGRNIYKETIPVDLVINDEVVQSLEMSQQLNMISGYVSDLMPGEYDIQAIGHKEPYVIQSNIVEGIEISKGNVTVSSNIYNEEIITSRYASIIIGLEESHSAKINANDFDANDFNITISKNNNIYEINDINISQLTDSYINLVGSANICDDGEWNISISYTGNNKYNSFSDEFTINAVRYEANIIYGKSNDNILCQLSSLTEQVQHNEEYVLMICTFKKPNDDEITIINITDNDGLCIFENPLNSALEWQQYDNFIIEIMPKNNNVMNIFRNADNEDNAINGFKSYFNNVIVQCSDDNIKNLYRQFNNNQQMCLFVGYADTIDEKNVTEIADEEKYGPSNDQTILP